jgi:hypothetical protein
MWRFQKAWPDARPGEKWFLRERIFVLEKRSANRPRNLLGCQGT